MSNQVRLNIPTEEENKTAWQEYFKQQKAVRKEMAKAVSEARLALDRLAEVMTDRSGQPYKVRAMLFSIWNGKPASVLEIVNLDWTIRKDLAAVLLAFGGSDDLGEFMYHDMQQAIARKGVWEWFLEERFNLKQIKEYAAAANEEEPT